MEEEKTPDIVTSHPTGGLMAIRKLLNNNDAPSFSSQQVPSISNLGFGQSNVQTSDFPLFSMGPGNGIDNSSQNQTTTLPSISQWYQEPPVYQQLFFQQQQPVYQQLFFQQQPFFQQFFQQQQPVYQQPLFQQQQQSIVATYNDRPDIFNLAKTAKKLHKSLLGESFSGSTVYSVAETQGHGMTVFKNSPNGAVDARIEEEMLKTNQLRFPKIKKSIKNIGFNRSGLKTRASYSGEIVETPHAEENSYRQYHIDSLSSKITTGQLKFHISSDIAHCVECWWAAHAMFKQEMQNFGSTIVGTKNCELKLFKNWTEPWVNFYKTYGENPFRDKAGALRPYFANKLGGDALVKLDIEEIKKFAGEYSKYYT